MDTTPYWQDTAAIRGFPQLSRNITVDVAVIGGGICGITAAYLLAKAGAKVALIERDRFASKDTGHTTAHLTHVTDLPLPELVRLFGRDHAQATWDAGLAAMNQIHQIVDEEKLDCEFSWVPGYLHAPFSRKPKDSEIAQLRETATIASELGFDASFVDSVPLVARPGVRLANQAKFHPRKYLAGLLKTLAAKKVSLFEQTNVEEILEEPLRLRANGHEVKAAHVFIATHVPLQGTTGTVAAALFQSKLAPYTSYVVGAKIPPGIVAEASFWDTNDPYYYLRIDRHKGYDYAIFGGEDHKTGQARDPERHFTSLEKRLIKLIPGAKVDHRWSGQVIETNDGLPFIGETAPNQFVATGFSGNGMTFGTLAAMMVRDAIGGHRNPWWELFDVRRKKLRGGTWDYLTENKDYPYYFIKDRLTHPALKTLRGIARGCGQVVKLEGKRVAAYRDEKGKLTQKSAVCPHMGCLVRWNGAEKTWDCPCHGSRFWATGGVIAGPAESGLSDL